MPWNLLILPLVGGYYILSRSNHFKYTQQRLDRQRLVFDSIAMGVLLLAICFLFKIVSYSVFPNFTRLIRSVIPLDAPFSGLMVSTFPLAVLFSEVGNWILFKDRTKKIRLAINKVGDELELICSSSLNENKLVKITLDSGKVYVAWVKELPIPSVSRYLRVIPVFSGYRDPFNELVFTTHYLNVYAEYVKEGQIQDINELDVDLVIPMDKISSLSYFDLDMYERFNKEGVSPS